MSDHHQIFSMQQESSGSFDTHFALNLQDTAFPFAYELSLAPLVAFWQQAMSSDHPVKGALAIRVQEALGQAPELLDPIADLSVIAQHRELVDVLMAVAFPPAFWEQTYTAALLPFHLRSFYATPSFERLLMAADGSLRGRANVDVQTLNRVRLLHAYACILHQVYGLELDFDYPLILTATDPDTGLDRHFRMNFDGRFLEVKTLGEVKALTGAAKQRLLANLADPQVLMEFMPPEQFILHGFAVLNAVEVTDQEVLSSLKRDLIEKESIISSTRFCSLQGKLRTLFRKPDLFFGLAALQGEQVLVLNCGSYIQYSCIFADSAHYKMADFRGSIYERAVTQGELLIVEDLMTYPHRTAIEDEIIQRGVRNIVVAPLYYQDELIGTLELGSPHPGDLHALNAMRLRDVLPLFSMAIKRSIEELNTRVQAIIKEQCTAIHPAVEWRFRKAALNWAEQRKHGIMAEMEPIVFEEVYPLYGMSDIRGSSTHRNTAIQADLADHLRLTREILRLGYGSKPLPILDALAYHVGQRITQLETGLGASDEVSILDFLRRDVEPLFTHMRELGPEVDENIQAYRAALEPHLNTVYQRRKDFEESVTLLNETLSTYLEAEEEKAQAMFPHYFEQHKSDGVEFGIYIGASLVDNGQFDRLYLHNLRLWQLMVMCGMARQAEQLKGRLKVPLETTHLILVQHTPLSIRFRLDEKRFDIDGAYNMRYEIVKKRIDKARIKGTHERLTQSGKIAMVYSQSKEALEYRGYIEYLQASGYLTEAVEEVEVEDLQGAQGLKALRVTVDTQEADLEQRVRLEDIEEAVQTLSRVTT